MTEDISVNSQSSAAGKTPDRSDTDGKTRIKTARNSNYLKSARDTTGYLEIRCAVESL